MNEFYQEELDNENMQRQSMMMNPWFWWYMFPPRPPCHPGMPMPSFPSQHPGMPMPSFPSQHPGMPTPSFPSQHPGMPCMPGQCQLHDQSKPRPRPY